MKRSKPSAEEALKDKVTPPPPPPGARNFTAERDTEVIPVALKIIKALGAREDLMMGSHARVQADKAAEYYQKVYLEDIVPIMIEHNLKLNDIQFLFSIILQPFQLLADVTNNSFNMNRDIADAKKYGIDDIDDMRVLDLDKALKESAEAEKAVDKSK